MDFSEMTDFDIIVEAVFGLQKISGTNDKKDYLKQFQGQPSLVKYLTYVYDEVNYVYGKSKVPMIARQDHDIKMDNSCAMEEVYAMFGQMNDGILKGNSSDEAMQDLLISCDDRVEQLCEYILKRDIKAKIGAKLINEVLGRVIPIAPYQRCESEDMMSKRIVYPALAQTKADGAFLNAGILPQNDVMIECTTRYGRAAPINPFFKALARIGEYSRYIDPVLHGELLLKDENGKIMNRQTGNGKINKYIKRDSTRIEMEKKIESAKSGPAKLKARTALEEADEEWEYIENNLVYVVWDVVPRQDWLNLACPSTVEERFEEVKKLINICKEKRILDKFKIGNCEVRLVHHRVVKDEEEAMEFYQEQLDAGEEGMVIKNLAATWEHDSNRQGIIKLKDFLECDLIITGWNYGKVGSEFEKGIGSLICESADGLLKVDVSGMKRDKRGFIRVDENDSSKGLQLIDGFDFDQDTGKIIAVKYNELIKSKTSDTYSLFLPSVLEVRESYDKSSADTLDKIKLGKKAGKK